MVIENTFSRIVVFLYERNLGLLNFYCQGCKYFSIKWETPETWFTYVNIFTLMELWMTRRAWVSIKILACCIQNKRDPFPPSCFRPTRDLSRPVISFTTTYHCYSPSRARVSVLTFRFLPLSWVGWKFTNSCDAFCVLFGHRHDLLR